MTVIKNIMGGIVGAVALNILHETLRRFDHQAPRVELVGEEALNKVLEKAGASPLQGNALYAATLAGDILSNALYYSFIGVGNKKYLIYRGIAFGAAAGIGAIRLTGPLGLNDAPVTRTEQTKVATIAYYLIGGIVTALTIKASRK